jgi:hypothetical protein
VRAHLSLAAAAARGAARERDLGVLDGTVIRVPASRERERGGVDAASRRIEVLYCTLYVD